MRLGSFVKLFSLFILLAASEILAAENFSEWKTKLNAGELTLLDRHGEVIHEERRNLKHRQHQWIDSDQLPKEFVQELVKIEDKRFFNHSGVDVIAFLSSLKNGVFTHHLRGGSTITMQVINLLHPKLKKEAKSFYKLKQSWLAYQLEKKWSKENILEAYLNLLPFKGELQGLMAASLALFQKKPDQLSFPERLWLLAMIPSPNQDLSLLQKRACTYGKKITTTFSCDQLAAFAPSYHPIVPLKLAPHYARSFKQSGVIQTSLDKPLQMKVLEILDSHLKTLTSQNVQDGAVLILDRQTQEVLAYIGSSGELSLSPEVDHVKSRRQAGSTLKPLLYAQAIEQKLLTMSSLIKDEPFAVTVDGLTYQPENYNKSFLHKAITLKEALGSSLNIPAIKTINLIKPHHFYQWLKSFNINLTEDEQFYGHSLALGAADITLWDLVHAYQKIAEGTAPLSKEVSFIMATILSEKENRIYSFGLDSVLSTSSWSAVKTGTSKDMRDNWCIGFTDRYVIGVWVGNSSGSPMWNVTGISGAAPIFSELVSYLHKDQASQAPQAPKNLVKLNHDYYLAGTEPRLKPEELKTNTSIAKILSPTNLAQYAYDPDIPTISQHLSFKAAGVPHPRWIINGKDLKTDSINLEKKGRFLLELWDKKVKKDEVVFYIKAGKTKVIR